MDAAAHMASGDPANFEKYLKATRNTICGKNAILVMMHLCSDARLRDVGGCDRPQ